MPKRFQYDSVKYPTIVFSKFRPEVIGAVALLHGVESNFGDFRYLEIGCGDGSSLLSTAASFPDSACVGIDLSGPRIEEAKSAAVEMGVTNAEFHCVDVADYNAAEFGKFDYIAAHGLYSWIPEHVRESLLQIYRDSLAPNGIGYISYNAYPGWHLSQIPRAAGRFMIDSSSNTLEDANKALEFIRVISECPDAVEAYREIAKYELHHISNRPREIVFHDVFAETNQPLYFTEFNAQITKHGLKFLTEAEPISRHTHPLGPEANAILETLVDDPIRREQCLDFIKGTRFRSSLICHEEADSSYFPDPAAVERLHFTSESGPVEAEANLLDDSAVEFSTAHGSPFSTNFAFTKSFLALLNIYHPRPVPFSNVVSFLQEKFGERESFDQRRTLFREHVVGLFHARVVEAAAFVPDLTSGTPEYPIASRFAVWQTRQGLPYVTSLTGQNIQFEDPGTTELLRLLDGTLSVEEVVETFERLHGSEVRKLLTDNRDLAEFTLTTLEQFGSFGLLENPSAS